MTLEKEGLSSQTAGSSSFTESKENSLDLITDYLTTKLKDIKAYEGTHIAEEAKKELTEYLHTLQKNETLFEALKEHNRDLAHDFKQLLKEHEHQTEHLHIKDHGLDFGR